MTKSTIWAATAICVLALAGCGEKGTGDGGKDAAPAAAGKADWNAADACSILDKAVVGEALKQEAGETLLGLVHQADSVTASTSECTYTGKDGATVARLMTRWSPINDNTAETIASTKAATVSALKAFSDTPVEDIAGLGKAAFFVPGIDQLTVFLDDARMIALTLDKVPDGASGKDIAVALAKKAGA